MMKLLHSADWHLDSPLLGRDPRLKQALLQVPQKVVALAKAEECQMLLLSGDIFDGACDPDTVATVQRVLADAQMPVLIAPGNHDPIGANSPWNMGVWPENVHIFRGGMESVAVKGLDCRVYGAAFRGQESAALLEGFRAEGSERYALAVLHGDPTQPDSPYNPISRAQVRESGLDYLALGHIHKADGFREGDTLCAWPGCPMGRGFDECGAKGVLVVTLDEGSHSRFVPLDVPCFHWLESTVEGLDDLLPAVGSSDYYRIDLVGEHEPVDLDDLARRFARFPNLHLRDHTVPPLDLWAGAGDDTLEGVYFQLLQECDAQPELKQLAARISRQLLMGREVTLP